MSTFTALLISDKAGAERARVAELSSEQLPEGNVRARVLYSTVNYKDALAITGKSPVVRQYPMVPGIDFVGEVEESTDANYKRGDRVILNGWGVGEKHWGGLSQVARVKGEWLIPLPKALEPKASMALGTAGYTAMLCVMALQQMGVVPADGPLAVSGAGGGVGSVAIMLLSRLGFEVHAITGRASEEPYFKSLGARAIVERAELAAPGKPLQKERWAGAVDTAGSHILANLCASTRYGGCVAACGLAAGMDLPTTVAPFILRGVSLVGVDSVMCPTPLRVQAWKRLAEEIDPLLLESATRTIRLADSIQLAPTLLEGKVRGRVVVDVNG